ncbi:Non-specific serine/threonine protein kinase [Bertholletia excelsa]
MGCIHLTTMVGIFIGLMAAFSVPICRGTTDPRDVFAINILYAALGFPPLPGWLPFGGDPCSEGWQGVQCVNANITEIVLNGVNLGGELGDGLGHFVSIIQIDMSNNHIGGSIPSNLPITIRSLFLSGNKFSGSVPNTLSSLGQLSDLFLNDNQLSGEIPDAFQQLTGLINLDLSGNHLSGNLPPSMGNLSSLTTLHLQNNRLIGTLDVLQDLPLKDLNVENNLFSGPIPEKLLNVPNFRRSGNPFNTTVLPSPPTFPPLQPPALAPSPKLSPQRHAFGPSEPQISNFTTAGRVSAAKKISWIVIACLLIFVLLVLGLCLCFFRRCKGSLPSSKIAKRQEMSVYTEPSEKPKKNESFPKLYSPIERDSRPPVRYGKDYDNSLKSKPKAMHEDFSRMTSLSKDAHEIDMTESDVDFPVPPPPPPPPFFLDDSISVNSSLSPVTNSPTSFTIASLRQYTDSFSQENLVGGGRLGSVYRAKLPNGKLLAVKKLDMAACSRQNNEEFLKFVHSISKLQHPNIVEFVGYCAEHGQKLLVYEYISNGTLHGALHMDDETHKKLSWYTRIRLALGAARALEYLHEVCQPPIVHQNFKSANILLDDEFVVHVSDCGLASLMSSSPANQLSNYGYDAPELELGSCTSHSDVYSFGVVMLEILTGREAYDRSRPRGEQFLVRWAIPQLHDIDALSKMVDPSLNGACSSKSLSRFADIISLCLQPEPEFRPPMSEIVQNLLQMI